MKLAGAALVASLGVVSTSGSVLGVEFGGDLVTVDQFKHSRHPTNSSGGDTPLDADGWPTEDFKVVVFDLRPAFAWAPPEDDPLHRGPYLAGTWQLGFNGIAKVEDLDGSFHVDARSLTYDPEENWSAVNLTLPEAGYKAEKNLLVLNFTQTQRSSQSSLGTGVTNITLVLPNHTFADAGIGGAFFSHNLVNAVQEIPNLNHARFMGALGINYKAGYYGVPGHGLISWDQRSLPTDPSWSYSIRKNPMESSIPWEYVIKYANTFKQDAWINVPVSATSGCMPVPQGDECWKSSGADASYTGQLAQLLKEGLNEGTSLYIEHSNEVWNFGFSQYTYNKLNALDVCKQSDNKDPMCSVPCPSGNDPNSTLPCDNQEILARRRHLQRVYEIVMEFAEVFGENEINNRIRGIYAEWSIFPQHYNDTLTWFETAYGKGTASKYLWGVAATSYFNFNVTAAGPDTLPSDATVKQVVDGYLNQSSSVPSDQQQIAQIARSFGLKMTAYEGGPGAKVGDKVDLANRINAHRDPEMETVMETYWKEYTQVYDVLHQFTLCGEYSRYGQWGAADFLHDRQEQPKWIGLTKMGA